MTQRPSDLSVEVVAHEWGSELVLAGVLDASARESLSDCLRGLTRRVRFTFRGIEQVNSAGVGVLWRILSELSRDHDVEFAECPTPVVDQFQMLEFSRYGKTISFYACYLCERCAQESSRLLVVSELELGPTGEVMAPSYPCACGGTYIIDDFLDFVRAEIS